MMLSELLDFKGPKRKEILLELPKNQLFLLSDLWISLVWFALLLFSSFNLATLNRKLLSLYIQSLTCL